jgi:hypothetical protein
MNGNFYNETFQKYTTHNRNGYKYVDCETKPHAKPIIHRPIRKIDSSVLIRMSKVLLEHNWLVIASPNGNNTRGCIRCMCVDRTAAFEYFII